MAIGDFLQSLAMVGPLPPRVEKPLVLDVKEKMKDILLPVGVKSCEV